MKKTFQKTSGLFSVEHWPQAGTPGGTQPVAQSKKTFQPIPWHLAFATAKLRGGVFAPAMGGPMEGGENLKRGSRGGGQTCRFFFVGNPVVKIRFGGRKEPGEIRRTANPDNTGEGENGKSPRDEKTGGEGKKKPIGFGKSGAWRAKKCAKNLHLKDDQRPCRGEGTKETHPGHKKGVPDQRGFS